MREVADAFDTPIVGGDTNSWDGPLVINVTLLGEATVRGVVRRKGGFARRLADGDGAAGRQHPRQAPRFHAWRAGRRCKLHEAAPLHAMIDVSDGLAADVYHICEESGCGAVLGGDAIPITDAARSMNDGRSPLGSSLATARISNWCSPCGGGWAQVA